ncbi:hypothetical protein DM860_000588 [Cuscuta australis]|uniref:Pentacotripeptide-repeat region of PRORP domain-containing protein n=1 Tax=Cuscuta australis TaxID=267555 RepID=A0A328CXA3_9ASTE|nr:hypothetical protein DM860_000588 [Cuscuta australis]
MNWSVNHLSTLLQNCMKLRLLQQCKQIHAIMLTSCLDMNVLALNSKLVGVYASCGDLVSAEFIFQRTHNPNIFAFNWMISALTFNGYPKKAIGYLSLLLESGTIMNNYTISIILKACLGLKDLRKGKGVHCMLYRLGFQVDLPIGNALLDMYGKLGNMHYARSLFTAMSMRDVATWTSMLYGYSSMGNIEECLNLFERMRHGGLKPNEFTWNVIISACSRRGDSDAAFLLLSKMSKEGLECDLVTWNAMISGFVQSHRYDAAFALFQEMLAAGQNPNETTFTSLLTMCGLIGAVKIGKEIHGSIYRTRININAFVSSALVDMYAKCGSVNDSWNAFITAPVKNSASWNSLIGCYGKHGMVDHAIKLFEKMQYEGIQATELTFTSLLSACSHNGLVKKGLEIFRSMDVLYGIPAKKEHYACIVDLLCRFGWMDEAYNTIIQMPIEVTESILGSFFNGCKVHERKDLVDMLSTKIPKMELRVPGSTVTLSNVYAAQGEWEKVETMRKLMKYKSFNRIPGSSWVSSVEDKSKG